MKVLDKWLKKEKPDDKQTDMEIVEKIANFGDMKVKIKISTPKEKIQD